MKRVREFQPVADATRAVRSGVWSEQGPEIELAPVFKTPEELAAGSPLSLDMTLPRHDTVAAGTRRPRRDAGDVSGGLARADGGARVKGMLRWAGIDPPKIHDVGDLLGRARLATACLSRLLGRPAGQ